MLVLYNIHPTDHSSRKKKIVLAHRKPEIGWKVCYLVLDETLTLIYLMQFGDWLWNIWDFTWKTAQSQPGACCQLHVGMCWLVWEQGFDRGFRDRIRVLWHKVLLVINTHTSFFSQPRGSVQLVRQRDRKLRVFQKDLFFWIPKEIFDIPALGTSWLYVLPLLFPQR